jgi:hypothetical protein
VPEAHYHATLEYLVSVMTESKVETATRPVATEEGASSLPGYRWSEDEWRRLWRDLRADTKQLLVVIAEYPKDWVPISVLNDTLDSSRDVRNALSSLTKRAKKQGLRRWGFEAVPDGESGGAYRYRMDDETADIVVELAPADQGDYVRGRSRRPTPTRRLNAGARSSAPE